uniref:Uncharacterized protein n=1 Tax=Anguilla anguilla TaxID=7936 RepID=A0A0E9SUU5_ANGAN
MGTSTQNEFLELPFKRKNASFLESKSGAHYKGTEKLLMWVTAAFEVDQKWSLKTK